MSTVPLSSTSSTSGSIAVSSSPSSSYTPVIDRLGVTQNPPPPSSSVGFPIPPPVAAAESDAIDRWDGEYQPIGYPKPCLSVNTPVEIDLVGTLLGPNVEVRSLGNRNIFDSPEGYIDLHYNSVRFGLRLPVHRLLSDICQYHTLVPGQFTPTAHRLLSCFLTLCHAYGLEPSLLLFHHYFQITKTPSSNPSFVIFSALDGYKILDGLDSSIKKWKDHFFFARHLTVPFTFSTTWGQYFYRLDGSPPASAEVIAGRDLLVDCGLFRIKKWSCLAAMSQANLLPLGAPSLP